MKRWWSWRNLGRFTSSKMASFLQFCYIKMRFYIIFCNKIIKHMFLVFFYCFKKKERKTPLAVDLFYKFFGKLFRKKLIQGIITKNHAFLRRAPWIRRWFVGFKKCLDLIVNNSSKNTLKYGLYYFSNKQFLGEVYMCFIR